MRFPDLVGGGLVVHQVSGVALVTITVIGFVTKQLFSPDELDKHSNLTNSQT